MKVRISFNTSIISFQLLQEMEDYNFFAEECHMNLLDDYDEDFVSHDIASALLGESTLQQQSISSECTSKTLSNSSTDKTSFERSSKLLKTSTTSSNSSTITENFSPKLSSSSSISSFQSQILSFDNSNSSPTTQSCELDYTLNPKQHEMVSVSPLSQKGSSKAQNMGTKASQGKRSPAYAQDHIIAERQRREKLSQSFIALAALVPGLKKVHSLLLISVMNWYKSFN